MVKSEEMLSVFHVVYSVDTVALPSDFVVGDHLPAGLEQVAHAALRFLCAEGVVVDIIAVGGNFIESPHVGVAILLGTLQREAHYFESLLDHHNLFQVFVVAHGLRDQVAAVVRRAHRCQASHMTIQAHQRDGCTSIDTSETVSHQMNSFPLRLGDFGNFVGHKLSSLLNRHEGTHSVGHNRYLVLLAHDIAQAFVHWVVELSAHLVVVARWDVRHEHDRCLESGRSNTYRIH
jgi:hypothetical protein